MPNLLAALSLLLLSGIAHAQCPHTDSNRDQRITVEELVGAVSIARRGTCPASNLPTGVLRGSIQSDAGGRPARQNVTVTFNRQDTDIAGGTVVFDNSPCFRNGSLSMSFIGSEYIGAIGGQGFYIAISGNQSGGNYYVLNGGDCTGDYGRFAF